MLGKAHKVLRARVCAVGCLFGALLVGATEALASPPISETQADFETQSAFETQANLNESAGGSLQDAERELEAVLARIARQYADKPLFLERLDKAQAAWRAFMQAELEAIFPPTEFGDTFDSYGSMYPLCRAQKEQALIGARIRALEVWLAGGEEGDVCLGSVKPVWELTGE